MHCPYSTFFTRQQIIESPLESQKRNANQQQCQKGCRQQGQKVKPP